MDVIRSNVFHLSLIYIVIYRRVVINDVKALLCTVKGDVAALISGPNIFVGGPDLAKK